ncbi:hypothetical protein BYT27DRAFT_7200932, partial [Phlegmacium glaucopus]
VTVKEHDVPIDQEDGHVALIIVLEVRGREGFGGEARFLCIEFRCDVPCPRRRFFNTWVFSSFSMEAWSSFRQDLP